MSWQDRLKNGVSNTAWRSAPCQNFWKIKMRNSWKQFKMELIATTLELYHEHKRYVTTTSYTPHYHLLYHHPPPLFLRSGNQIFLPILLNASHPTWAICSSGKLERFVRTVEEGTDSMYNILVRLTPNIIFGMCNIWVILRRNVMYLYSKKTHLDQLFHRQSVQIWCH
jgi:hypothetical protein